MIVELFGPPGAGKTTFSHELARRLQESGFRVELALSQRPAEMSAFAASQARAVRRPSRLAAVRRIIRPMLQLLRFGSMADARTDGLRQAQSLVRLFPQGSALRVLRLRQYLIRLHGMWRQAAEADHVVIFDQAFVQTVFSLACNASVIDPEILETAMEWVPRADLLIEIRAPLSLLQARLGERLRSQGRIERLLERDAVFSPGDAAVLEALRGRLRMRRRRMIATRTDDPRSSGATVEAVRKAVALHARRLRPLPDCPTAAIPHATPYPAGRPSEVGRRLLDWRLPRFLAVAAVLALLPFGASIHWTPAALAGAPKKVLLHFTPGQNFDAKGGYQPGRAGFNLADVSSVDELKTLPDGTLGLVWVGTCEGAGPAFRDRVKPFFGNSKVFGYYLMDDPDPSGRWKTPCPPANLRSEADWIKQHHRGAKTFIALMNMSSSDKPSFANTYTRANSHVDLYGLGPYPCRSGRPGCDLDMIDRFVNAALAAGIDRRQIVPIFQAFGQGDWRDDEGGSYVLPTQEQEAAILRRWNRLVPNPVFDFAYSWGMQRNDQSLASSEPLIETFRFHNMQAGAGRRLGAQDRPPQGLPGRTALESVTAPAPIP